MIKNLMSILLLTLVFYSCTREKYINIEEDKNFKPKIVANATINQSGRFEIRVTRNIQLSENIYLWEEKELEKFIIPDCKIELFRNENIVFQKTLNNTRKNKFQIDSFDNSKPYSIRVTAPNFDTVWSELQNFPEPIEVDFEKKIATDVNNYKGHDFYFNIKSSDTRSYYYIRNLEGGYFLGNYSNKFEFCDLVESIQIIFNNKCFQNDTLTIVLNTKTQRQYPEDYPDGITVKFRFYSITEDFFKHLEYLSNDESERNPFVEPFTTYSNMSNGLGIFGLYFEKDFVFKFN